MAFNERSLENFWNIYKHEYGEELSSYDLERKARILLNLYLSIYENPSIEKTNHEQSYDH
jgi:hypothetical protein